MVRATGGERSPVNERRSASRKIILEMSGIGRGKNIRAATVRASARILIV
jgi:hypothetical protein